MKYYLGLNNLRSIDMESPIELRPLTILLGKNTAGKSTFLRTIPLLRQSKEERLSSPIQWNGEYVDFENYDISVRKGRDKEGISFNFGVESLPIGELLRFTSSSPAPDLFPQLSTLQVLLNKHEDAVVRKKAKIEIPDLGLDLEINNSKDGRFGNICINQNPFPFDLATEKYKLDNGNLFSTILTSIWEGEEETPLLNHSFVTVFVDFLDRYIKDHISPNKITDEDSLLEVIKILQNPIISRERLNELENMATNAVVKKFFQSLRNSDATELDGICKLYVALATYEKLCDVWENLIKNSIYLGPSRVKFKRYNRVDEFETSEIFFDGRNLPSFLSKLESNQFEEFSDWLIELFGFGVGRERKNGHISILSIEEGLQPNLADTGYGISQILPIAAQIWWDSTKSRKISYQPRSIFRSKIDNEIKSYTESKLIAIEQPELHLHPAHQASLANLFVNAISKSNARKSGIRPIFVVETHSEALINRLGNLVGKGKISSDDIQVLIFSREGSGDSVVTNIHTSYFHEKGYLVEWPYGFFGY